MGVIDRRVEVVGNENGGHPTEELEGPHVRRAPVDQFLGGQGFGIGVAACAQDRDEELGPADHAGVGIDDRDRVAGRSPESTSRRMMVLAHDEVELADIGVIGLGEPGVTEALGMTLTVFGPQQSLGDTWPAQLSLHNLPVRDRPGQDRRRRSGPSEEPLF